jgi:hypothetical protein
VRVMGKTTQFALRFLCESSLMNLSVLFESIGGRAVSLRLITHARKGKDCPFQLPPFHRRFGLQHCNPSYPNEIFVHCLVRLRDISCDLPLPHLLKHRAPPHRHEWYIQRGIECGWTNNWIAREKQSDLRNGCYLSLLVEFSRPGTMVISPPGVAR